MTSVGTTGSATQATYDGGQFTLIQPLTAANKGKAVSMTWDFHFSGVAPGADLTIEIDRGNIGATTVTLYNTLGATPVAVESTKWAGLSGGSNLKTVSWPVAVLLGPAP
jgi:hypothetical protein